MILALDAGNSRVKWGLWEDRGFIAQGSVAIAEADALFDILHVHDRPQAVIGSNVAGPAAAQALAAALQAWQIDVRWIESRPAQCGVTSHYLNPNTLGTDRWAALIGAHRRGLGACIVVDAGTAVTVDALTADGAFLGGLILPGVELMARALADGTAGLPLEAGRFEPFPRSTMNAIRSGAMQAITGAIERLAATLQERAQASAQVVVAGGAGPLIVPLLSVPPVQAPALVLEGLVAIAQESP